MKIDIGLPDELLSPPYPNIGLAGLNLKNPLHASIWDAFSTNMHSDNGPGRYMLINDYNVFPKRKELVPAISKPAPTGILHRNWFNKHLNLVPAAVILFYELDWNDSHWTEKQLDCGLQLNYLRSGLGNRATKLAVVLIQKNALPTGEDTLAMERATSLSNACELMSNSLFVLPVLHADHLVGYVIRLQNVFIDQAVLYYLNETKRIKNNKDTLNRPNYQLLQARHLIKVSFFHEIRKDIATALKHYNMTYNQLLDTKVSNEHEIKVLCGFINFKICQLSFRTGAPLDAIAQFDRHVKHFKIFRGYPYLEYQHKQWLSQQFQFFGDLFNDAISAGLTALQTKHPGFYYLQAAQYTMERRGISNFFREEVMEMFNGGKTVIEVAATKYFGQFPWEVEHHSEMTNGDLDAEDYMRTLQKHELDVEYSRIIIPLLNNAVGQFKQYKPTRMKRYLMIEMGNEYYYARDYEKAFSIAMCVLHEYRKERWWSLLTAVLDLCLKCAYLVGNVHDYLAICCELISARMTKPDEEKTELQNYLFGIVEGKVPQMKEGDESTLQVWGKNIQGGQDYTIEMSTLSSFLSCSVSFSASSFQLDEKICLKLRISSTAVLPVQFNKVIVQFDNVKYNQKGIRTDPAELLIQPQQEICLDFEMDPLGEDAGTVVKIISVKLHLASVNTVILQYGDVFTKSKIGTHLSARIIPRNALATTNLNFQSPFLVGEFQQISSTISNSEKLKISNIKFLMQVKSEEGSVELSKPNTPAFSNRLEFVLGCLEPGESTNVSFVARCNTVCKFDVSYILSYSIISNQTSYLCEARKDISLSSVLPFNSNISLMNSRCETIETLLTCDRCLIYSTLSVGHAICIEIDSIKYEIDNQFIYDEENTPPAPAGNPTMLLSSSNIINDCITIQPKEPSNSIDIGVTNIFWRRYNSNQEFTTTPLKLPTVRVNSLPVYLTNTVPSAGTIFYPVSVKMCIVNISNYVQEIDIVAETGDLFMFAGHRHLRCKILPNDKEHLQYQLVPLMSGLLPIPQPTIKLLRHPEIDSLLLTNKLTKSIYVKPKVFVNT